MHFYSYFIVNLQFNLMNLKTVFLCSAIDDWGAVVSCQLSVVSDQLSVISYQLISTLHHNDIAAPDCHSDDRRNLMNTCMVFHPPPFTDHSSLFIYNQIVSLFHSYINTLVHCYIATLLH